MQEAGCGVKISTHLHQHFLDVLTPLGHVVALGDLNGEQLVLGHEGRQPRQALPTTATHTNLQRATPARHVLSTHASANKHNNGRADEAKQGGT